MSELLMSKHTTRERSVRRARTLLTRIIPFRDWVRERPRTSEARDMYKLILRELGAIIAGHRPDTITAIAHRGQAKRRLRKTVARRKAGTR